MRAAIRTAVELLGTGAGLTALARQRSRDRIAVLAYHNVVPAGEAGRGDASLHLPLPAFIDQIDAIARTHEVVPLDAVSFAVHSGNEARPPRPRAVITFDDAYRGAVTLALPELIRRGLPATVFVSPGLLGSDGTWWDLMAEAGVLPPPVREQAFREMAGRTPEIIQRAFRDGGMPSLPPSYGIATADELRQYMADGITLGSHAWAHEYLPALPREELEANLARTLEWLREFPGRTCSWLALPYGAGSSELGRAALGWGHAGVLRVTGGLWGRSHDLAQVPRINVPAGVSLRGLELRTSGLRR